MNFYLFLIYFKTWSFQFGASKQPSGNQQTTDSRSIDHERSSNRDDVIGWFSSESFIVILQATFRSTAR